MRRFQRGDAGAFPELVRRHRGPVFAFVLRWTSDRARAEDILQETWLKVVRGAEAWSPRARFSTWLYTIARNACVDGARRERSRASEPLEAEPAADERSSPERAAASVRAPSGAGGGHRRARPSRSARSSSSGRWAGVPFHEIARITGAPEPTVKSRMRYALEALRDPARRGGGGVAGRRSGGMTGLGHPDDDRLLELAYGELAGRRGEARCAATSTAARAVGRCWTASPRCGARSVGCRPSPPRSAAWSRCSPTGSRPPPSARSHRRNVRGWGCSPWPPPPGWPGCSSPSSRRRGRPHLARVGAADGPGPSVLAPPAQRRPRGRADRRGRGQDRREARAEGCRAEDGGQAGRATSIGGGDEEAGAASPSVRHARGRPTARRPGAPGPCRCRQRAPRRRPMPRGVRAPRRRRRRPSRRSGAAASRGLVRARTADRSGEGGRRDARASRFARASARLPPPAASGGGLEKARAARPRRGRSSSVGRRCREAWSVAVARRRRCGQGPRGRVRAQAGAGAKEAPSRVGERSGGERGGEGGLPTGRRAEARLAEVRRSVAAATGDARKALLFEQCRLEASLELRASAVGTCSQVAREFPGTPEAQQAVELARGFSVQPPRRLTADGRLA